MFEIGSYVSYRADGVCKIVDIRRESFGAPSEGALYYVLHPKNDERSEFFLPVENERTKEVMRPLLSGDEIASLVKEISGREFLWIDNAKSRGNYLKRVLSEGDRAELIYILMLLFFHAEGKKTCATDELAKRRASQMLFEEFSMSIDISSADAIPELIKSFLDK
ncbi:MAG: CarD family transcriptional regulator [Clostridia bacterium]|nr:CarD family transcriptional regulator [Clostridia bacterium]